MGAEKILYVQSKEQEFGMLGEFSGLQSKCLCEV